MADPTILAKIVRMLGQATNRRGVGMLGPLSKGLAEDPEILAFMQAASKAAKGVSPKVLQDASSEYADLLQGAAVHFKRGLKPPEAAKAAKTGMDEYLTGAQDKLAKYGKRAELTEEVTDPKSIFAKLTAGEEGSRGLGVKAEQIYAKASPELKAYLDHIVDPTKPYPNVSKSVIDRELQKLRVSVGEARLKAPQKATGGAKHLKKELEVEPGPGQGKTFQQTPGKRGHMTPEELEATQAKAEASVPEGQGISGAIWPGFEAPRPLAEPSGASQIPIRGEFGPLDVPPSQTELGEIYEAFKSLFSKTRTPGPKKPGRSLKSEVSPE